MIRGIWIVGSIIGAVLFVGYSVRLHRESTPPPPEHRGGKEVHVEVLTPSERRGRKEIRVEVLNGCGTSGAAGQVGRYLRTTGFDVMTVDNAGSFNYPETLVIDRVGNPEYAARVAEVLGTPNRIQQIIPDPFRIEQVTVIVGGDYKRFGLPLPQ